MEKKTEIGTDSYVWRCRLYDIKEALRKNQIPLPSPSSATAEEILVKHGFFLMKHKNSNEEVRKAFIEPVLSSMHEFASIAVAEATKDTSNLAEYLYKWMRSQKYGTEDLLHAAVCCDFVGVSRFKKALAKQIDDYFNNVKQ